MELSVQDWLIVIGALLIVGVLLDAYRRYRAESRNPIRMGGKRSLWKLGDGFREDAEAPGAPSAELPAGTARVRNRAENGESPSQQTPLAGRPPERVEPRLGPASVPLGEVSQPVQPKLPGTEPESAPASALDATGAAADGTEVVVIHVLARQPGGFSGEALLQIFQACDVRHGQMDIFHRHEEEKGQGAVQFSVANVAQPGTFDIGAMRGMASPGLSFFMRLPGPLRPLEAFDCMLETARVVAKNLDGEMQDQSRSVFTTQTAEHCRQRIREFVHRTARTRR
jgi:cell division protein ZipA